MSDALARQGQHFALTMQDAANELRVIGQRYLAEMSPQLIQLSKWIKDFFTDIINAPYVHSALKEVLSGVDTELKKLNKNLKHFGELVKIVWEEAKELVKRMAAVIVKHFGHYIATNPYSNEIMPLNWQEQHFINVSNKNGMYARARHFRNRSGGGGLNLGGGIYPTPDEYIGSLKKDRERFAEELKNDPGLKRELFMHAIGENTGVANLGVIEEGMNRASLYGHTLRSELPYYTGYRDYSPAEEQMPV